MATDANRTIEMYRLWEGDEHKWDTVMVEIPADTPDDRIEAVGRIHAEAQHGPAPYMLYNSMEDDRPEN